jgi:hypothetical protein
MERCRAKTEDEAHIQVGDVEHNDMGRGASPKPILKTQN